MTGSSHVKLLKSFFCITLQNMCIYRECPYVIKAQKILTMIPFEDIEEDEERPYQCGLSQRFYVRSMEEASSSKEEEISG